MGLSMSWDEGYVSQVEYVHAYHGHLNPLLINLALIANGHRPPTKRPLRYLELGFGQGLSLNINAAACEGEFWGNDFNPSHAANAKNMARASGANVTILDDSFAELAARTDLPEFDVIALHGVWSWVSDENRHIILEIIRSKLALGGVLYISYNTTPGWSSIIPVRELMMLHVNEASEAGSNISDKIDAALNFSQQLIDIGAAYFNNTPSAAHYIDRIKNQRRDYVAHELFNADWAPMPFSELAAQLTEVNLSFVGDAAIGDIFSDALLSTTVRTLLTEIKDPLFHQSVRDYCFNQPFRKDLWMRGEMKLAPLQKLQLLSEMRFTLLFYPTGETLSIPSGVGSLPVDQKIMRPMIEVLAENNFSPKSISELLQHPKLNHMNLSQACETILLMCGHYVAPAQDDETIEKIKLKTDGLNTFLINQAVRTEHNSFLASPVTGGGVSVSRIEQLFLLAIKNGFNSIDSAVPFVWNLLTAKGHCMTKPDGTLCNGDHENRLALTALATPFFESRLRLLTALKVF